MADTNYKKCKSVILMPRVNLSIDDEWQKEMHALSSEGYFNNIKTESSKNKIGNIL